MTNAVRKIAIVGATSAIAEHCARLWVVEDGTEILLIGRDPERLEAIAQDLRVRNDAAMIGIETANFLKPSSIHDCVAACMAGAAVDTVLIAHGTLPDQEKCQDDLEEAEAALHVNGVSPALFAEAFAKVMAAGAGGTIGIIGSVAGDRGRKSNYVYGAAKGLVTRYAQGLQHRFAGSNVKIVLIKPGPTDTPMTAHLKDAGAGLAKVEDVARDITKAIAAGVPTCYTPRKWQVIMLIIRHLPRFVFDRMNI